MSGPVAWDLSAKTRIFLWPLRRLLVSGAPNQPDTDSGVLL